jgi:hypothetical protein
MEAHMRDDEDEAAIALRAVEAWLDVEGDDDLAQASREALAAIAQEALAMKEARERREAAERRAEVRRERERRAERERAEARERAERWKAERNARDARLAAVAPRVSGGSRLPPRPRAARRPCGWPGSGRCSRRVRCVRCVRWKPRR